MANLESRLADTDAGSGSYSRMFLVGLIVIALMLSFSPIPVTALRLMPVYLAHAQFLVFYAPFVCVLLLAYLFYIRDYLARLMFADLIDPAPAVDPYYQPRPGETFGLVMRRVRNGVMALAPALLLLASFACLNRYFNRLDSSVALAIAERAPEKPVPEEVGLATPPPGDPRVTASKGGVAQHGDRQAPQATVPDGVRSTAMVSRDDILRTQRMGDIPLFTDLTISYIGIFATALMAVFLMALKEYAKEAMGLTEQDLVLGDWVVADPVDNQVAQLGPPGR
jgi:hypothetical protein